MENFQYRKENNMEKIEIIALIVEGIFILIELILLILELKQGKKILKMLEGEK